MAHLALNEKSQLVMAGGYNIAVWALLLFTATTLLLAAGWFWVQYLCQLHSEQLLQYSCALRIIFMALWTTSNLVLNIVKSYPLQGAYVLVMPRVEWIVRLEQALRKSFPNLFKTTKVLFQRQYPMGYKTGLCLVCYLKRTLVTSLNIFLDLCGGKMLLFPSGCFSH